jgi:thiamine-monophosphate kinase
VGEFELINTFFTRGSKGDDVVLGIGDDCAIVRPPAGRDLVMSIDTLVEGVHFPHHTEPLKIGMRVMCTCLSDLAAMGATPHWFTLALTLLHAESAWLSEFSEGLFQIANQFQCSLIGGDTTKGPLTISVQVHGSVAPGTALKRGGGKPGDIIYVTGDLGDGAAALAALSNKLTVNPSAYAYLMKRFFAPTPRIQEGQFLSRKATAAIDISDGLIADLGKLCSASGLGAMVDVARLPISQHWRDQVNQEQALDWALNGGDDYQLCFTLPPTLVEPINQAVHKGQIRATPIGKLVPHSGVQLFHSGQPYQVTDHGYDHFG